LLKRGDGKIKVLHKNVETVRVYLKCAWTVAVGMSGAVFVGITAQEIAAACHLAGVPRSRRESVADGIRIMQSKAGPLLNKKAAR
jgi:Phage related hypothetical protein (DUF1799)